MATVLDAAARQAAASGAGLSSDKPIALRKKVTPVPERLCLEGVLEGVLSIGKRAASRGVPEPGTEAVSILSLLDSVGRWAERGPGKGMSRAQFIVEAQRASHTRPVRARMAELRTMAFRGVLDDDWVPVDQRRKRKRLLAQKAEGDGADGNAEVDETAAKIQRNRDAALAKRRAALDRLAAAAAGGTLGETAQPAGGGSGDSVPGSAVGSAQVAASAAPQSSEAAPPLASKLSGPVQAGDEVDMYDVLQAELGDDDEDIAEEYGVEMGMLADFD